MAPDPTAVATLGLLLLMMIGKRPSGVLVWPTGLAWALALGWCASSAATLWAMGSAQGWVLAAAALTALTMAWATRRETAGPAR